jgi:hypothetical protein
VLRPDLGELVLVKAEGILHLLLVHVFLLSLLHPNCPIGGDALTSPPI